MSLGSLGGCSNAIDVAVKLECTLFNLGARFQVGTWIAEPAAWPDFLKLKANQYIPDTVLP